MAYNPSYQQLQSTLPAGQNTRQTFISYHILTFYLYTKTFIVIPSVQWKFQDYNTYRTRNHENVTSLHKYIIENCGKLLSTPNMMVGKLWVVSTVATPLTKSLHNNKGEHSLLAFWLVTLAANIVCWSSLWCAFYLSIQSIILPILFLSIVLLLWLLRQIKMDCNSQNDLADYSVSYRYSWSHNYQQTCIINYEQSN